MHEESRGMKMRGRAARSARRAHDTMGSRGLVRSPAGKSVGFDEAYPEVREGALRGRVGEGATSEAVRVGNPKDGVSNTPPAICNKEELIKEVQKLLEELKSPWIVFNTPKRLRLRLTINQYMVILSVCDELNAVKRDMDEFGKELEKIENNFDKLKREAEELLNEINSGVSEYGYGSRN